ncbi:MAG: Lrp/AsnC ligand binding domain-containing protein [Candidatus Freyarchaeum deiterrae]
MLAFMIFDIAPGAEKEILETLEGDEAVRDIYVIAGEHDLVTIVSLPEYNSAYEWLAKTRTLPSVKHIKCYLCMDTIFPRKIQK